MPPLYAIWRYLRRRIRVLYAALLFLFRRATRPLRLRRRHADARCQLLDAAYAMLLRFRRYAFFATPAPAVRRLPLYAHTILLFLPLRCCFIRH